MIGPTDLLHSSPAPHLRTFHVFLYSGIEVNNVWSCTSTRTCAFISCTKTFYLTSTLVAQCPNHYMTKLLSVWQYSACSRYNKIQLAFRHVWGSCVIAPLILDLCSRWRSIVSFISNPFTPGHAASRVRVDSTAGL